MSNTIVSLHKYSLMPENQKYDTCKIEETCLDHV